LVNFYFCCNFGYCLFEQLGVTIIKIAVSIPAQIVGFTAPAGVMVLSGILSGIRYIFIPNYGSFLPKKKT
jgi:hypothetical protein